MPRISSGKRYARAVFELALEKNELELWQAGLNKIADLATVQELMTLLQDPRVPFDVKKNLLQKGLGEIQPLVFNLAALLVSKGILSRINDIFQQYNRLLDAHQGVERAKVTTALPLGTEEQEVVSRRLGEIVDRNVMIEGQVDPSIIGGFIARIRDTVIDGSVHQKLETLKKNLIEAGK